MQTVTAIHVPSVLFAPLYVALARGYFRQEGIDLKLSTASAGQDAMPLLANGQLDVLIGGFSAGTFNAINRGLNLRVVSSMGAQPKTGYPSGLMVRSDLLQGGQVKSLSDLKGKKIAISGGDGSTGAYWVAVKLREAGLTLKDVNIVNMGFPDMVIAFQQKAIDAAYPPAPFTSEIKKAGTADFFGGPASPGASAVGTAFGGPFMQKHPDLATKVMVALVKGARDIQGQNYHAPENLAAYNQYTKAPIATLKSEDAYAFDPNLAPDEKTLSDMQSVFMREGILSYSSPLPMSKVVDAQFQQAAVKQLGPYKGS